MAHPDLDNLLNALLPFAQEMLGKYGEFHPFGASVKSDGTIALIGAADATEHPKSTDLIELLEAGLRRDAADKKIRASGICCDVRVTVSNQPHETDAIQVSLEHSEGEVLNVFLPYEKKFWKRIHYGKMLASKGDVKIFPDPQRF